MIWLPIIAILCWIFRKNLVIFFEILDKYIPESNEDKED